MHFPETLFEGKTVFVTGGSSGINLGIACCFAEVGANIAICGRTREKLDLAEDELSGRGANVVAAQADVRDPQALTEAFSQTEQALGPIHTLICGAAGNFPAPAHEMSPNGFKSVVDIDLLGSFNACRGAFDQLQQTKGNVIFISAGQSFTPYAMQAHVGAAKAGVDNLMQNLALEWGPLGIRSNSIAPGPVEGTEGVRRMVPEAIRDEFVATIPLRRLGAREDIGRAAVFLASPMASYVTGTRLVVDGGQNLPGSGVYSQLLKGLT